LESTLIKITNKKLEIIRPGKITVKNILKFLPYIEIFQGKNKKSFSGTSKKHYSPKKKIFLNQRVFKKDSAFINFGKDKRGQFKNLSKISNLNEAAKNLYHFIFLADKNKNYKTISMAPIPEYDLGIAINDRLKRASK
jgi:L-threonylcarbamoyladenylate synthase